MPILSKLIEKLRQYIIIISAGVVIVAFTLFIYSYNDFTDAIIILLDLAISMLITIIIIAFDHNEIKKNIEKLAEKYKFKPNFSFDNYKLVFTPIILIISVLILQILIIFGANYFNFFPFGVETSQAIPHKFFKVVILQLNTLFLVLVFLRTMSKIFIEWFNNNLSIALKPYL